MPDRNRRSRCPTSPCPATAAAAVGLADFAGRKLVLYFYPKDDTSGCTLEAHRLLRAGSPTSRPPAPSSSASPRTA